jgi:hypothetical protein
MLDPAEFSPHPLTDRARKIRANLARAERDNGSDNLTNTISAIRALGDLLRSEDSTAEDHALEALHAGRAVFWSSATYHNQAAVRFLQLVNTDMALEDALAACVIDGIAAASEFALLATLIPAQSQSPRNAQRRADLLRAQTRVGGAQSRQPIPLTSRGVSMIKHPSPVIHGCTVAIMAEVLVVLVIFLAAAAVVNLHALYEVLR